MAQLALTFPTCQRGDRVRVHDAIGYPLKPFGVLDHQVDFGDRWWIVRLENGKQAIFGPHEFESVEPKDDTHDNPRHL